MKIIKKMIADYDALIKHQEDRMNKYKDSLRECQETIDALDIAMKQVAGIEDAEEALATKRAAKQQYMDRHGERFFKDAQKEYESVKVAKKHFIAVMQQNCEHDMQFDHCDHHKNEDFYTCNICGLTQ